MGAPPPVPPPPVPPPSAVEEDELAADGAVAAAEPEGGEAKGECVAYVWNEVRSSPSYEGWRHSLRTEHQTQRRAQLERVLVVHHAELLDARSLDGAVRKLVLAPGPRPEPPKGAAVRAGAGRKQAKCPPPIYLPVPG